MSIVNKFIELNSNTKMSFENKLFYNNLELK